MAGSTKHCHANSMSKFLRMAVCLLVWPAHILMAQQPAGMAVPVPDDAQPGTPQLTIRAPHQLTDERYRMGPGDLLEVTVFGYPELAREIRIDGNGMISMPLLDGNLQAACRTPDELEQDLANRYLEYLKRPQIQVLVKEYSSQPVVVVGAVTKPGTTLQLERRVRVREMLAIAGGPSPDAGKVLQIVHDDNFVRLCHAADPSAAAGRSQSDVTTLDLAMSASQLDPYLNPGDIISVPQADQAFVVGNVYKPTPIALNGDITVTRAIAMAGGTLPDTKSRQVQILRHVNGTVGNTQIVVNLEGINRNKKEDPVLRPGDIVYVPPAELAKIAKSLGVALTAIWAGYGAIAAVDR